jgi:hypothetical protein
MALIEFSASQTCVVFAVGLVALWNCVAGVFCAVIGLTHCQNITGGITRGWGWGGVMLMRLRCCVNCDIPLSFKLILLFL